MYKRSFIVIFSLFLVSLVKAEPSLLRGVVIDENNQNVIGAHVRWMGSQGGTVTDANGLFTLPKSRKEAPLLVSYVGYTTDTIQVRDMNALLKVQLRSEVSLAEVTVSARKMGTISSRIEPLQVQKITSDELCRAACCNLAESFVTNPSVDVAYSDAATGAKQIKLLGLSGSYVQMLTENAPNFRGASALYGLDYVPGPWMESIQVSKGTSSVKNGYEAITGQINVEYKKPQEADPLSVNLFVADNGRAEANVDGHVKINEKLATGLFAHYSNDKQAHDGNDDGFLDLPQTEQVNLFNRWYYKNDHFISQAGVKYIHETRENGQLENHAVNNNRYTIGIKTNRAEFFTKNAYIFDPSKPGSVALIVSGAFNDQQSRYGVTDYNFQQNNLYGSLMYETEFTERHRISTGLSLNYDYLSRQYPLQVLHPGLSEGRRDEAVSGAYFQYTYNLNDKLVLLAGIRGDYHNQYGFFVTPRFHAKWDIIERLHWRASIGKGYKSVNPVSENSYMLASSRKMIIREPLNMEDATNYGTSLTGYIPLFGKDLTLTAEYYRTDFRNQVVMDVDSNPHEVSFYNLSGQSYAQNFQIEASYPVFRGMTLTAAYRLTDAKTTYNGLLLEKPLTNRYKGLVTASYQTPLKKWQFDYTVQFNGGGRMPTPDAVNPMWDTNFSDFTIMNAQITKYFRTWSIYLGGENLLNFKQKNPVIEADQPWGDNFDATMVWGPIHGRKIYLGVRWSLPSKD